MAGSITISTLKNDTGVFAVANGMTGIPKAWVNFTGSSGAINGSFNVSSVTRSGTGDYTVNYTTALSSANYAAIANSSNSSSGNPHTITFTVGSPAPTTTTCRFRVLIQDASAYVDPYLCNFTALGA